MKQVSRGFTLIELLVVISINAVLVGLLLVMLVMMAALRYALGDPAAAYFAADASLRNGDQDAGTRKLKLLVESTMDES